MHSLRIITNDDVLKILEFDPGKVRALVRQAYIMHDNDLTVNPAGLELELTNQPDTVLNASASVLLGPDKIIGLHWGSDTYGSTVIILNDYKTFLPIACISASMIRAAGAAISAILACELLQRKLKKNIRKVCLLGSGLVARYIGKLFAQKATTLQYRTLQNINPCEAQMSALNELILDSDLLILTPLECDVQILDNIALNDNPIIIDLAQQNTNVDVVMASNNITDDIDQALQKIGALRTAFEIKQSLHFINGTLGSLLQHKFSLDKGKPTIFSPVSLGAVDLCLAQYVYQCASRSKQYAAVNMNSAVEI